MRLQRFQQHSLQIVVINVLYQDLLKAKLKQEYYLSKEIKESSISWTTANFLKKHYTDTKYGYYNSCCKVNYCCCSE